MNTPRRNVMMIGATNNKGGMDDALSRDGSARMQQPMEITREEVDFLKVIEARIRYHKNAGKNFRIDEGIDFEHLAQILTHPSSSNIGVTIKDKNQIMPGTVKRALQIAIDINVREAIKDDSRPGDFEIPPITEELIMRAIRQVLSEKDRDEGHGMTKGMFTS